jgi:hypothetical protein
MNERIRELSHEAQRYALNNTTGPDLAGLNELWQEKFAELIIQECIDCARGAGLADDVAVRNGLGFNDGISEAVTHMKQHFGVEE